MSVAIIKLPIHYSASATQDVAKERRAEELEAKDRIECAFQLGYRVIATSQVIQDRCTYQVFVMFMLDEDDEDNADNMLAQFLELKAYITGDENHD